MAYSRDAETRRLRGDPQKPPGRDITCSRWQDRLQDEVYREMFLLESNRPGSEMGLALALLHAVVEADSLPHDSEIRRWLKTVYPIALRMIESSLDRGGKCPSA
jgi:hypothetical protein